MSALARSVVTRLCLVVAVAAMFAGCGSGGSPTTPTSATTLTVYSSLPLQGPDAADSLATVEGEKLALTEAGAQAGAFTVKYVSLDDSTASSNGWDARQSAKNSRMAAQDRSAIAYLGDFDAGATAITLPTLNEVGILQISPATTLVGLTRSEGADKGEPEKYYPTGKRTFGRVIPADNVQAAAQLSLQKARGCTITYLVHDREAYGKSLTDLLEVLAPKAGQTVVGEDGVDPTAKDFTSTVDDVAKAKADCVFFGAINETAAVTLFQALHAANPGLRLFAPNALATPSFATALGAALEPVTFLTSPALPAKLYPPAGRAFLRKFRQRFGSGSEAYAMYGYEAMQVALLAIRNAGTHGGDKQAVVNAFFAVRNRRSILGTYSIDGNGDTSLNRYGSYRIRGGRLLFQRLIAPPAQ